MPQPINALGIELIPSSLVSLTLLVRLDKAARLGTGTRARPALVIALGTFAAGILVAGAFCVAGSGAAMNLYALSALTGLAWGVDVLPRASAEPSSAGAECTVPPCGGRPIVHSVVTPSGKDFPSVFGMKKSLVAAIVATAVAGSTWVGIAAADAATNQPTPVAEFQPGLKATLQTDADALLKYGAPGVLVEVDTPRGNVRVRSGYGNVAKRTPVPWDAKFRIGSFTKPFVSATVLQLAGERKLSLDDKVEKFLPGLIRSKGNDGRTITVRQLLQHTSGLPEYTEAMTSTNTAEEYRKTRLQTWTSRQLVGLAMQLPRLFAPGTNWSYTNTNYVLASMIIEKVTGHTWQQEVRNRIVKPLGLRHTYLPGTTPTVPRPHAVGYQRFSGPGATPDDPRLGEPIDATLLNPSVAGAAGEIISTTHDTDTFLRALISGKVLKPVQLAEMQRTVPVSDALQARWPGARYGLGLLWASNSCGGYWSHGGDITGFMTRNGVTPDGSRSVTVSINTDSLKPGPGVELPTADIATTLVDHALCGGH